MSPRWALRVAAEFAAFGAEAGADGVAEPAGGDGLHFIYLSICLFRYLFKRWVGGGLKIAHCKPKSVRVGEAKGLGMLSNVNKSRR